MIDVELNDSMTSTKSSSSSIARTWSILPFPVTGLVVWNKCRKLFNTDVHQGKGVVGRDGKMLGDRIQLIMTSLVFYILR